MEKLEDKSYSEWDAFVESHPNGTIFHTSHWLKIISQDIEIYVERECSKIAYGIALISTKKMGVKGFHVPPLTQYFGPLTSTANGLTNEHYQVLQILTSLPKSNHYDFKLTSGHHSPLPFYWSGFQCLITITYKIDSGLDDYWKNMNKNKKRELKKVLALIEKGDIEVCEDIDFNSLNELLDKTEKRGNFYTNRELFFKIFNNAKSSFIKIVAVKSKIHGYISFGLFPYDGKAVYNLVNFSARMEDPVLKTVNLLTLNKAIEFALNTGRVFDFEGSMLKGVETFNRLMGGRQAPVYRVQKSPSLKYSFMRALHQLKNDKKKA